jgi:small-conductance mechanosensitive channel
MTDLVRWFSAGGWHVVGYVAFFASVALMPLVPRPIRRRLRFSLVLGAIAALADGLERARPDAAEHGAVQAFGFACAALAAARVLFVLAVDIGLERRGAAPLRSLVTRDALQGLVYLFAIGIGLQAASISPMSLLATSTVIGAIVGLSLQDSLGNFASGIALAIEHPIAIGDWVRIDKSDFTGRVVQVTWRSVIIQTDDRNHFVIPHGVFSKTAFTNFSRPGGSIRRSLYFTFPFEYPPAHVQEAILAACHDAPDVMKDPAPSCLTWLYTESGVQYWLRYHVADFTRGGASQSDVTTRVWYHLHRRKISAAVPVRQTFLHEMDKRALADQEVETLRDRRAAIDAVDFLHPLSDAAKQEMARRGHRRLYGPKETIIVQGERARGFYMVRRGEVAVLIDREEKHRLGPGDFFGEIALLTGSVRRADVVATEETEVFEIDQRIFKDVLRAEPKVAEEISRIVAARQAENALHPDYAPKSRDEAHTWGRDLLAKIREAFALD